MKKANVILAIFGITLLIALSLSACSQEANDLAKLQYEERDGKIAITGCHGAPKEIRIPEKINDLPVTIIGDGAFSGQKNLTSITLPQTLEEIGVGSFAGTLELRTIEIPKNVTKMGAKAFESCGLKKAVIPGGIKVIESESFTFCPYLEEVVFEEGVIQIGSSVFYNDGNLKKIVFSDSIEEIGQASFVGAAITNLKLPANLKRINEGAFTFCHFIEEVVIPEGTEIISPRAFIFCDGLRHAVIPASVKELDSAFGKTEGFTISAPKGSAAAAFAEKRGIPCKFTD